MPRQRRTWEPSDILSVVVRSHEGRPIFVTEDDRSFFVERLGRVFEDSDGELLSWALLRNHFHLLMRVGDAAPGVVFLRLNTVLARRERALRGDHGCVFQDRYWSRRCADHDGVLAAMSYILGNPVHHGVVSTASELERYPWTAYPEILGHAAPGLVDADRTLRLLHPDVVAARETLRAAVASRIELWRNHPGDPERDRDTSGPASPRTVERVGSPRDRSPPSQTGPSVVEFVSRVHDERADRAARLRAEGWSPADLLVPVCRRLGADPAAVLTGVRTQSESRARSVIAHCACDGVGTTVSAAAELLGVSGTAVTAARRRGRRLLAAHGWSIDDVLAW